ncbi:MAG TPA: hypothetical protein PLF71_03690 [bacterium]|nr:MAG: DNA polymerase III subunit delta [Parcubacteria group bacterium ADurb.Bin192]HPN15188.1 hypothetical protein [bacterium]
MLIICAGPESFLARQKVRELIDAYQQKHDPSGRSIERLEHQSTLQDVLGRLGNMDLFASKKLLKYENLLTGLTPAQTKKLNQAVLKDADQNIVLTEEDKLPPAKIMEHFSKEKTFVYEYQKLSASDLRQAVVAICRQNELKAELADRLIALYPNDLWAINTAVQMISVSGLLPDQTLPDSQSNLFNTVDNLLQQKNQVQTGLMGMDAQEILPLLISQALNWHKVKHGQAQGVHPYVQKKLLNTDFQNPDFKTINFLRCLYATRSSLAGGKEIVPLI